MKMRLVLFRHGEAKPEGGAGDHARQLTPRGMAQAAATGSELAQSLEGDILFLVSDAARTRQTFGQIAEKFPSASKIEDSILYLAGLEQIKDLVARIQPSNLVTTIVVVGHNPGLSLALSSLAGDVSGLGTADAAVLSVESESWSQSLEMDNCWAVERVVRSSV